MSAPSNTPIGTSWSDVGWAKEIEENDQELPTTRCWACKGKGDDEFGDLCWRCDGSGEIKIEI